MNRFGFRQVVFFLLYLVFQVIFLKNLSLFGTAFCFAYVGYLLLYPVETNPLALMAIGFAMGLLLDLFYESPGLHASASVLITYFRRPWLNMVTPQGGYDVGALPSLSSNGLQWFLVYILPLILIHHVTLFFVEVGGLGLFWHTLGKALASTLFTALVVVLLQYLFPAKRS